MPPTIAAAAPGDDDQERYELLYEKLKNLAKMLRRRERQDHTLNSTALVNEVYLKLAISAQRKYESPEHFLAIAARVMRQVLVDYARSKLAGKRGAGALKMNIDDLPLMADQKPESVIALNDALDRLALLDPRQASMVDMRYFGGMSEKELADHFKLSTRTIVRELNSARTWLFGELNGEQKKD